MSIFKKAKKSQSKLRLAMFAPSGGGKTYTALRIATGLGGKIAVIDTERGSASKYADRFEFDVAELTQPKIENYIATLKEAAKAGYDVIIIDSLSHGWQELLEQIDKLAATKYRGNTFQAWGEGTPLQRSLVNAILSYPGHVLATMRVKTEWSTEKDERTGKMKPVKLGTSPEQGKGIEYEFDMLMEITVDHVAHVSKDRTGKFQDAIIDRPGEDFGIELLSWLNSGKVPEKIIEKPQPQSVQPTINDDPPEEKPKTATNSLGRNPNIDYAKELYGGGEDAFSGTDENLINKMSSLMAEIEQLIIDNCHESEKVFFVDQAAEAFDKSNLAELEQIKKQLSSRVKSNSSGWTEPEEFVKVTIPELQKKITTALIILGKQGIYGYENQTRLDNSVKSNIGNLNCQDREKLIKYIIKLRERYNEFKQQQK